VVKRPFAESAAALSLHPSIKTRPPDDFTASLLLVCSICLMFCLVGCKKSPKTLTPIRIHGVTRQLATTAKNAAPPGASVQMVLSGSDGTDHLEVIIPRHTGDETAARTAALRVLQSLNGVAVANDLTQDHAAPSGQGWSMVLRHGGVATHTVRVAIVDAKVPGGPGSAPQQGARLAILLDDLGSDRDVANQVFALPYPLTISVLPEHAHSVDIAEEARRHGDEVMLHLPMQSVGKEQPEKQELRPGMSAAEVSALVDQFLNDVPGVDGVNNHQGSQATADPVLMNELMRVLEERHVFYVDSRTTAATVAYDTARQQGVPAGFRNVPFLDDVENVSAIERQITLAMRGAHEKGEAIAIGHPHPATLEALRTMLPKAKTEGIQLVLVSELVH
jgi:polysaccharide deacetylase 2 family uncharacterized protein YibQ